MRSACLVTLLVALISMPSAAQGLPGQTASDSLDTYYIDFSVPDLAAFSLLGLDGSRGA